MSDESRKEDQKQRSSAASFVKWALLIVIGIPMAWFAFCEARMAYWDWRVTQMCEKDGGVSVHDVTFITRKERQAIAIDNGHISIASKSLVKEGDVFYSVANEAAVRSGNPDVIRREEKVFRINDDKQVGKIVTYSRRGGDSGFFAHPTSHACPTQNMLQRQKDAFIALREE